MNGGAGNGTAAARAEGGLREELDFELYRYTPSLPAAIIATAVFAILTALHTWRMFRSRAFYFIAFTIGGLFETVGYAGRIQSHFDKEALSGFIMQSLLILVAPALFAASIYMILGRLIRAVRAEHLSLLPVGRVTKIFVTGDIVSFTLQGSGGGIQAAGSLDMFKIGEKVILGGLFVQILVFGFFVATSVLFHRRLARNPTPDAARGTVPWRRHLWVLYVVSTVILVRSIFRVVEYIQGNSGYLISNEVFLYVFDAILMAAVMAVFFAFYVGDLDKVLRGKEAERLDSSDAMLEELPQRAYSRP